MQVLFRILFTFLGVVIGYVLIGFAKDAGFMNAITNGWHGWMHFVVQGIIIILFALIFYWVAPTLFRAFENLLTHIEADMESYPLIDILWGTFGLIIGLLIAYLISIPLYRLAIPYIGSVLSLIIYLITGYIGSRVAVTKRGEISQSIRELAPKKAAKTGTKSEGSGVPKVLDTSVIIDGRIADITQAGFIEGPLLVPTFVLKELQGIADSSDTLKRNRGRRGLDILKRMQDRQRPEIIITEETYDEIPEVDIKLLKLARDRKGVVVTNDYNLNKVAKVQGIEVLNINDLANAVKPVYIPGEEMTVEVVQEGKEAEQGLAYLDDGTMIVVENGRHLIGKAVDVTVTSVLQTSAGKMIFAKTKE